MRTNVPVSGGNSKGTELSTGLEPLNMQRHIDWVPSFKITVLPGNARAGRCIHGRSSLEHPKRLRARMVCRLCRLLSLCRRQSDHAVHVLQQQTLAANGGTCPILKREVRPCSTSRATSGGTSLSIPRPAAVVPNARQRPPRLVPLRHTLRRLQRMTAGGGRALPPFLCGADCGDAVAQIRAGTWK